MSAERLEVIDRVVQRGITAGGYPGASVVIGRKGSIVWQKGFGALSWGKESAPVIPDRTIYDLASLTKVVGTTTACTGDSQVGSTPAVCSSSTPMKRSKLPKMARWMTIGRCRVLSLPT